jgi:hypothetical protein
MWWIMAGLDERRFLAGSFPQRPGAFKRKASRHDVAGVPTAGLEMSAAAPPATKCISPSTAWEPVDVEEKAERPLS